MYSPLSTQDATHTMNASSAHTEEEDETVLFAAEEQASPTSAYHPVPTPTETSRPPRSVHTQDGVFANLSVPPSAPSLQSPPPPFTATAGAPPSRPATSTADEKLPDYNDIANDRVPSYFETVVIAPAHLTSGLQQEQDNNTLLVDGLEVGSLMHFSLTTFITAILGFIGFFITYTFSNTHAGRAGAQTGFGIFTIRYALTLFERVQEMIDALIAAGANPEDAMSKYAGHNIAIYFIIVLGWCLIFSAVSSYIRAVRTLVLQLATSSSMV